MVEMKGILIDQSVSILIEPGSNFSYIAPQIVEACVLQKIKYTKSWLVHLSTRDKRKVIGV